MFLSLQIILLVLGAKIHLLPSLLLVHLVLLLLLLSGQFAPSFLKLVPTHVNVVRTNVSQSLSVSVIRMLFIIDYYYRLYSNTLSDRLFITSNKQVRRHDQ